MSAANPTPSKRPGSPQRRRAEVLETAARMFAEKGYEATTSQDIGNELGMLRGSIYYYFESKEMLLFELIEQVWVGALAYLEEILASDADPVMKLDQLIRRHILYLADNTVDASLFLHETRSLSPEHRKVVAAQELRYQRAVTQLVKDGQRQGLIRRDLDPKLVMFQVLGAVNWIYRWYQKGKRVSAARVADQFARSLLEGLLPR
jgi:AcrR family transcriptional regulator